MGYVEEIELFGDYLGTQMEKFNDSAGILTEEGRKSLLNCLNVRLRQLYRPLIWREIKPVLEKEMPAALHFPSLIPEDMQLKLTGEALEVLLKCGKHSLWEKYPELMRREKEMHQGFHSFVKEFLSEYKEKKNEISKAFFNHEDSGRIIHISCVNAETRPHSRMTLRIDTERGRFYYKPRSCTAELFYQDIIKKFFPETGYSAKIITGGNYAFMEAIEKKPLASHAALRKYYYHLGLITAVFFVLLSGDMHAHNFIAHGVYPVPIDLEYIMTPRKSDSSPRCVSHTNILYDNKNELMNSVLYNNAVYRSGTEHQTEQTHLPELFGEPQNVFAAENDFISGFSDSYRTLMKRKKEWLDMIHAYPAMNVRISLRLSQTYNGIFAALYNPDRLVSAAARDDYLETLWTSVPENFRNIVRSIERPALLDGDFPDLHMKAGEKHLYDYTGSICKYNWRDSPISCIEESFALLSEVELAHCVDEIRSNISTALKMMKSE